MTDIQDEIFHSAWWTFDPRPRRKKPEAKVQSAIVSWLLAHKVVLAITDAGALAKVGLGIGCGIPKGWPDITGCLPGGRFIGVECKAKGGRQSPAQKRMQGRIEANGGIYVLAESLAALISELHRIEQFEVEKTGNSYGLPLD